LRLGLPLNSVKKTSNFMITNLVNFSIAMLVSVNVTEKRRVPYIADTIDQEGKDVLHIVYRSSSPGTLYMTIADTEGDPIFNQIITWDSLRKSLEFVKAGVYDEIFEVTQLDGLHPTDPVNYQVQCMIKDVSDSVRIVRLKRIDREETIVLSVFKTRSNNFLVNIYNATQHLIHLDTIMI
jgi:hypothetical protein